MSDSTLARGRFAAATAVWPAEWVPKDAFAAYVAERAAGEPLSDEALASLYLACACMRRVAAALAAFETQHLPGIKRAGSRAGLSGDQTTELAQILREELLVGRNGRAPTLGEYRGRGDLRGWLRVTATREAVRMKKRAQKLGDPEVEGLEARATDDDPELSYMKSLYRDAFRAAFRAAAGAMDPKEKRILYQHTVEGLTIDEIGAEHGVHRATAARWAQAARESLFTAVRRELAASLRVSPKELASVLRLVQSHLEVTMKRLLA